MATLTPEEQELWRLTMEHSPVGMALMSPDGRYLRVNPALCEMIGYAREELIGLTFHHITHPDDLLDGVRLHQGLLADSAASHRTRKRYLRPDGTIVPVDLSMVLHRADDGTPLHFMTQVVDLSEKQDTELRLGLVERQMVEEQMRRRAILDTDAVGLSLVDLDGRFHSVNATQQRFFDLAFPGGHPGRVGTQGHIYDATQTYQLPVDEIPSSRAARGEELDSVLVWAGPDPLTRRALVISARNVRDGDGRRTGAAMVFQDVTEMMRAVRAKDQFVASVSHELRTPLTSALGNLELLHEATELAPERRRQVEVALRNVLRLSHMVADVLLASQAMSGSVLVDAHDVDLAAVVHDAVAAIAVQAEAHRVRVTRDVPESFVTRVDGLRIRQVVDNLLNNAVVFAPGADVVVRVEDRGDVVALVVADTGEGVDPTELPQVFDWFFRGASTHARQVPGAGLGLSIVRTIVEAHGGTVTMSSTPSAGTTVEVLLPR